jgi:hypothetical protein
MDFGLQYTHPLSKTESVTLGLVFSPKNRDALISKQWKNNLEKDFYIVKLKNKMKLSK